MYCKKEFIKETKDKAWNNLLTNKSLVLDIQTAMLLHYLDSQLVMVFHLFRESIFIHCHMPIMATTTVNHGRALKPQIYIQ